MKTLFRPFVFFLAAALASAAAPSAAAPCSCSNASLLGTTVSARYETNPNNAQWTTATVTNGVEFPSTKLNLAQQVMSPKWNIDVGASSIKITFLNETQTYPGPTRLVFSGLHPIVACAPNMPPAHIAGITVTSNTYPAQSPYIASESTFTADSVSVAIGFSSSAMSGMYDNGHVINIALQFACAASTCDCSQADFVGQAVQMHYNAAPVFTATVPPGGIDVPGTSLGMPASSNVDIRLTGSVIKVQFLHPPKIYPPGSKIVFVLPSGGGGNVPAGCTGPRPILSITAYSDKPGASYVASASTFTANSMSLHIAPNNLPAIRGTQEEVLYMIPHFGCPVQQPPATHRGASNPG